MPPLTKVRPEKSGRKQENREGKEEDKGAEERERHLTMVNRAVTGTKY